MKKTQSKKEAEKQIEDFFSSLKDKTARDVKKIKRLAMAHNIKLGEKRKFFCKMCLSPHKDASIRIKNDIISINCGGCGYTSRWKINSS